MFLLGLEVLAGSISCPDLCSYPCTAGSLTPVTCEITWWFWLPRVVPGWNWGSQRCRSALEAVETNTGLPQSRRPTFLPLILSIHSDCFPPYYAYSCHDLGFLPLLLHVWFCFLKNQINFEHQIPQTLSKPYIKSSKKRKYMIAYK